jgi:hypothetical protein
MVRIWVPAGMLPGAGKLAGGRTLAVTSAAAAGLAAGDAAGEAAGDAAGEAAGLAAGDAAGLAAGLAAGAAGLAAGEAAAGLVGAAGGVVGAGAAAGWQATINNGVAIASESSRRRTSRIRVTVPPTAKCGANVTADRFPRSSVRN